MPENVAYRGIWVEMSVVIENVVEVNLVRGHER
jgi:hypothetical protein